MTLDEFDKGMRRLEAVFNHSKELQGDARGEYIEALRFLEAPAFDAAVTMVIETFKPWKEEPFPSPFTIQDAVTMAQSEDAIFGSRRERGAPDSSAADYCQRCQNSGLFLGADGESHICQCEKGRMKRASWDIPYGVRKREARIQDELDKLPSSKGPVRGLMEKNALGFWEANAIEHERWCAAKRKQIEEIKRRREEGDERRRSEKKTIAPQSLKRVLDETLAQVSEKMPKMEEGREQEALRHEAAETRILTRARRPEPEEPEEEFEL